MIIGAMKCATSTLHEQLVLQPGITMSTPKEPCFFSNNEIYQRGLDWYVNCFADNPATQLRGESSTHYTKLPTYPHTIERLQRHVPNARFVYVMRHPVDRLVSHYIHDWSERIITCSIDEAIDQHPNLIEYGRYAMQLAPFLDAFGHEQVLPVFFDRLHTHAQAELQRICRFIDYEGTPRWHQDRDESNVSSRRLKKNRLRDAIVFAPGISSLRRSLIPVSWRERIKQLWMMSERPELCQDSVSRLQQVFDEDLAQLGRWLGVSLSCEVFKTVTSVDAIEWITGPKIACA